MQELYVNNYSQKYHISSLSVKILCFSENTISADNVITAVRYNLQQLPAA